MNYFSAAFLVVGALNGWGASLFVDPNSTNPVPPYTGWSTAAITIQDAIDAAVDGDLVLVTNGIYSTGGRAVYGSLTNRVVVDKAVTVQSVTGPSNTMIVGNSPLGATAVRCVYLTNGATLSGFTLTNGSTLTSSSGQSEADRALYASGGGAWCESTAAVVTNCVLTGNEAEYGYGGMGGGAYSGTLLGCTLTGNRAVRGGGAFGSVLIDCVVSNNLAMTTSTLVSGTIVSAYGGGVQNSVLTNCSVARNSSDTHGGGAASSTLVNCDVTANLAYSQGGGVHVGTAIDCRINGNSARSSGGGARGGTLSRCFLSNNSAAFGGGASLGTLNQCVLSGNQALLRGGGADQAVVWASALVNNSAVTNGGGAYGGSLTHCTVAGNSAPVGGGTSQASVTNSVVYFNHAPASSNYSGGIFVFSCTAPLPAAGPGNLAADPLLADGYHLSAASPCIGAAGPASSLLADIDGDIWMAQPSIGCDEHQPASLTGPITATLKRDYANARPGAPIQFAVEVEGGAASSAWDFGDGTLLTNQPYVAHAWSTPGVYTVHYVASNSSHPEGVTNELEVHVMLDPVLYVSEYSPAPQPPFLSWGTAATNIQDAIDLAFSGGSTVLVSNGVYRSGGRSNTGVLTNRVCLTKPVTVQSVNGPEGTLIEGLRLGNMPFGFDGQRYPGYSNGDTAVRCAYVCDGASLIGFTLTNGATRSGGGFGTVVEINGGGVFCQSLAAKVSNCVIVSNTCIWQGAGAYSGTLSNCQVINNRNLTGSLGSGGGVAFSTVIDSLIEGNHKDAIGGGGAYQSTLSNCLVRANSIEGTRDCTLYHCVVSDHSGCGVVGGSAVDCDIVDNTSGDGSVGGGATGSTLTNCRIAGNRALNGGGAFNSVLHSCTLSNNYATHSGGGVYLNPVMTPPPIPSGLPGNDNLIIDNSAGSNGGGLHSALAGTLAFTNWTFTSNSAGLDGGGLYIAAGSRTLQDCTFVGNWAGGNGGGLFGVGVVSGSAFSNNVAQGAGGATYNATLTDSVLIGNQAQNGGGAASGSITGCSVVGNIALGDGGGSHSASVIGSSIMGNHAINGGGVFGGLVGSCSLSSNSAALSGGGYYASLSYNLTNCSFEGNMAANGGGLYASGGNVSNCTFIANSARTNGGGLYTPNPGLLIRNSFLTGNRAMNGGAGFNGVYSDCTITWNTATNGGGGIYVNSLSASANCLIGDNVAFGDGGGVFGGTWNDCRLIGNEAGGNGGAAHGGSLMRAIVAGNRATLGGGAYNTTLRLCLISSNAADTGGGAYCANSGSVNHCTVVGNSATNAGGGVFATSGSTPILSSIVYFNDAPVSSNYSGGTRTYCCLMPASAGTGNITNDPSLLDFAAGNMRLQTNSPCIDAGGGSPGSTVDLDGRPSVVGDFVDMGAYEFQGPGIGEFTHWLQQYGLPSSGLADYQDTDSDRLNNWQEWVAGTIPTNATSVLRMFSPAYSPEGTTVSWQSLTGKTYWVERIDSPGSLAGFSTVQSNIPGLSGLTSYLDDSATNSAEYYYRVGVR